MTKNKQIKKFLRDRLKGYGLSAAFFRKKPTRSTSLDFCNAVMKLDASYGPDGSDPIVRDCFRVWGGKLTVYTPAFRQRVHEVTNNEK